MLNLNERYWKPIPNYEGYYEVHREGYVRNSKGLILKTYLNNSGYKCLKLVKCNKREHFLLHRLVALAFVKNKFPYIKTIVNHEDGDKLNCRWTNLKWCDNSYNILHARRTGLNPYNKPTVGKKLGKSSVYRGVTWDKSRGQWRVYVRHNNQNHFARRFESESDAAKHYNWIVKKLKLKDRPLNIIQ